MKTVWCSAGSHMGNNYVHIKNLKQDAERERDDMIRLGWENISPVWSQEVPA